MEQQTPDRVEPSDDKSEEGDKNCRDQCQKFSCFDESGPSYEDFYDPVDAGDQKQNDLNETGLFVKPSCNHEISPFYIELRFAAISIIDGICEFVKVGEKIFIALPL